MPPVSIRGFEVAVETEDGSEFTIYGTPRTRGNTIFATIQAIPGRFQIRVRAPQFPGKTGYNLRSLKNSEEIFVAHVYIQDGSKAEDDAQVDSDYEEGVLFEGRPVSVEPDSSSDEADSSEFTCMILPWVFTPRGIDVLLAQMDIHSKTGTDIGVEDSGLDIDMVDLSHDENKATPSCKIEIHITREVIIETNSNPPGINWSKTDNMQIGNEDTEIIAGKSELKSYNGSVKIRPLMPDEAFYCKFVFTYHDITKLQAMGLARRDGTPIEQRKLLSAPSTNLQPMKRERDDSSGGGGDDDTCSSDSTSDSDMFRPPKRRGAITSEKRKSMKNKNKLGNDWQARKNSAPATTSQALEKSTSIPPLPEMLEADFDFDIDFAFTAGYEQFERELASTFDNFENNEQQVDLSTAPGGDEVQYLEGVEWSPALMEAQDQEGGRELTIDNMFEVTDPFALPALPDGDDDDIF